MIKTQDQHVHQTRELTSNHNWDDMDDLYVK